MSDRDEFISWLGTRLRPAEIALHEGDPEPRLGVWSEREPITLLGAWYTTTGRAGAERVFRSLAGTFGGCVRYETEWLAVDVAGDLAYTVGFERTTVVIDGRPTDFTIRVTQVYRREDGGWKVVHRHGDLQPVEDVPPD